MKYLVILALLIFALNSCMCQNCDNQKQEKLRIIFPKDKWIKNLNLLVQYKVIESIDFTHTELDELYKTLFDSACNNFSNEELDKIIIRNNSGQELNPALSNKLLKFVNTAAEIGAKWATTKYMKETGYEYNEGVVEFYRMNYKNSLKYFEERIYKNQEHTFLNYVFYGRTLIALNEYGKAIASFKKAIEIDSQKAEAYYFLANAYLYGISDIKSAFSEINKSIALEPKRIENKLLLGEIYCGNNDFENGIKVFNGLLSSNINNTSILNARGKAFLYSGDHTKALKDLKNVLQIEPINREALLNMGRLYMTQKNFDSAEFYIKITIKNYPYDNAGYSCLAANYTMKKDYKNAIECFTQSIEIRKDYNEISSRGFAYLELGEYKKARIDFQMVIDNAENSFHNKYGLAYAYNNLGYVEYKLGDNPSALKNVEKSLMLLPDNSYAYRNKALILIAMHQKTKACEALMKAKSLKFSDFYGDEVDNLLKESCN